MNERIRELAKQTGYIWHASGDPQIYEFTPEKLKTFAELIVRECCSKLEEMGDSWHEIARNPPDGQAHNASGALFAAYRLKEDAVDEIKQHFGVEE